MLSAAKASSAALLSAARSYLDRAQYNEAGIYVEEMLRRNVDDDVALAMLGDIYAAQGRKAESANVYARAIYLNPTVLRHKERFIAIGGDSPVAQYSQPLELVTVECLKTGAALDCQGMWVLWLSHLYRMPSFRRVCILGDRKDFDPGNAEFFEKISDFTPLLAPYFLLGLRHIVAYSPVFEEFICHLRRRLLENSASFTSAEILALASALSHYSFNTDYILDETEAEWKKLEALRAHIEKTGGDPVDIALFACYASLCTLQNAAHVEDKFSATPGIDAVIRTQITDYHMLQKTAADIPAITPIDDAVSGKVRAQYEDFPFPRWRAVSKELVLQGWRNACGREEARLRGRRPKILVAGCGTGKEAIELAMVFPDAEILAVDLSRSSLAYAVHKAKEYDIGNITFRQADILRLGSLDEKFDYIAAGGVLHHMEHPLEGWKVLRRLLKPDGVMRIGLYSKRARFAVIRAWDAIRQGGYGSDAAGMKAFRGKARQLLEGPVFDDILRFRDYYHLNMYRDLLFHVQEHSYDLLEVGGMLRELELDFAGFMTAPSVLAEYSRRYPDDPERVNLANWHNFEEKFPATFRYMYVFWCR